MNQNIYDMVKPVDKPLRIPGNTKLRSATRKKRRRKRMK
jgi:molybdenum cofactor biosynthesis enzyme